IIKQESLGYTLSASAVRNVVEALLKQKGDLNALSYKWIESFKKRNPQIRYKI
ncbi:hypothetical protein M406DRAFT_20254, partial [Cryphonectria parasitica EP155]